MELKIWCSLIGFDTIFHIQILSIFTSQEFKDFDLEQHQECQYDNIEIYDGEDRNGHSLGKFCGSRIPEPIIAGSGNMFISFYSDASVSRKGFRAEHSTSKCVSEFSKQM